MFDQTPLDLLIPMLCSSVKEEVHDTTEENVLYVLKRIILLNALILLLLDRIVRKI